MANQDRTWVFASGSLMWEPGFDYLELRPALLRGYQRAFCIYSLYAWGSHENPGLVLGLLPGGTCHGLALCMHPGQEEDIFAYLDDRESAAYQRQRVTIEIEEGSTEAYTYIANPGHPQYAGILSHEQAALFIRQGRGHRGESREYLKNIVQHLNEVGICDSELHRLMLIVETL